jgi:hypothetical protein
VTGGVPEPATAETPPGADPSSPFGARPPGRPLRRVLVRIAQAVFTVVVTVFILEKLGPGIRELLAGEAVVAPRWGWIAAACAMLALGYGASAWIWSRMVRDLGGPRLGVADAVRVYMVASLGRYVPGKLWAVAGLAMLARGKGVPAPVATAAAVIGQAVALAGAWSRPERSC